MLSVVPTPLGNLKDITLRALEALKSCDLVAAEDTRRTLALLSALGIGKKVVRYNEHSERCLAELMGELTSGKKVALVSDGGTPGVSDPGRRLVALARGAGVKVEALPGPCAAATAASGSGLPADSFVFLGFLPRSRGKIIKSLRAAFGLGRTVILYESPYRAAKFMALLAGEFGPGLKVVMARELTKLYEEWLTGTAGELAAALAAREVKGEIVILIEPPERLPEETGAPEDEEAGL